MADAAIVRSPKPKTGARYRASKTVTNPFATSPSSVTSAAAFRPLRRTLVAPGLPEPYERGSGNWNIQLATIAKETEPIKYAATIHTRDSMPDILQSPPTTASCNARHGHHFPPRIPRRNPDWSLRMGAPSAADAAPQSRLRDSWRQCRT